MHRVSVILNDKTSLGNFQYETSDLNGTIDPVLHNVGDGSAAASLRLTVYQHKRNGSAVDVTTTAQCSGTASPDNCYYGYVETTQWGDGYSVTVNSNVVATRTNVRGRVVYEARSQRLLGSTWSMFTRCRFQPRCRPTAPLHRSTWNTSTRPTFIWTLSIPPTHLRRVTGTTTPIPAAATPCSSSRP